MTYISTPRQGPPVSEVPFLLVRSSPWSSLRGIIQVASVFVMWGNILYHTGRGLDQGPDLGKKLLRELV